MKKLLIIILICFALFPFSALAQEETGRKLEVNYFNIPGSEDIVPKTTGIGIENYILYGFYAVMAIGGIIAFGILVFAGFRWMTAGGRPAMITDARERIFAAMIGLALLFGSVLILTTINTDLLTFKVPPLDPLVANIRPGVIICEEPVDIPATWGWLQQFKKDLVQNGPENISKETFNLAKEKSKTVSRQIAEKCHYVNQSEKVPDSFLGDVNYVYYVPEISLDENGEIDFDKTYEYGSIFYNNQDFSGSSEVVLIEAQEENELLAAYMIRPTRVTNPRSIRPFKVLVPPQGDWGVTLYQLADQNARGTADGALSESFSVWGFPDEGFPGRICYFWLCVYDLRYLRWSPVSYEATGDLIINLCKTDSSGNRTLCHTYVNRGVGFNNNILSDSNLFDYEAFDCGEYELVRTGSGADYVYLCKKPAATLLETITATIL